MSDTAPLRAAIYARYSTDKQKETSVEDQVRLCRRHCEQKGWQVTEIFADHGISGTTSQRPDYLRLVQAAERGAVDVIVAESLNRLSRDQADTALLFKRMNFLGVRLHTVADQDLDELKVGVGGLVSALYIKDIAQKTRRGLEGRVVAGKSAGGISYGYRVKREIRADGTLTTGERTIDPEEAEVSNRTCQHCAAGHSARAIASALNAAGISAPQSGKGTGTWNPSTISGNVKRGTGILNNELYTGRLVWNRLTYDRNPDTGKRQSRQNPPSEWKIQNVPELRIVDDLLWDRVKARQEGVRQVMNPAGVLAERPRPERARRPTYLLSGLLRCGCCGASYTLINKTRYGCAAARNKGGAICTNRATIERDDVEDRVLSGLKHRLLSPDLLEQFTEEYRKAFNASAAEAAQDRQKAASALTTVETKISSIFKAIEDGMYHASMKAKMSELEAEQSRLQSMLEESPEPPALRLHPSLSARYRELIEDLARALNAPEIKREAAEALRGLISEVRMVPEAAARNGHAIELVGDLAGILSLGGLDATRTPALCEGLVGNDGCGSRI